MKIKTVSILGTGTMGHGVALLCAQAGLDVLLYGRSDKSLNKGMKSIESSLEFFKEKGKLHNKQPEEILCKIKFVKTIIEVAQSADLVIECLAENLELKQDIFKKLDEICPNDTILSSCTSGLLPTDIAKSTKHPERVVVAHFWNPPQLMPLVEVVPGERTSDETMKITMEWVEFIGKKAIRMEKECQGFIGNRLQHALLREALYIVEQEWAKPEEVDKAIEYGLGRRLPITGPICTADLAGLDTVNSIASYLLKDLCNSNEPSKLLKSKVKNGELGSKSGRGFYNWAPDILEKKQKERAELLFYFLERDTRK
ncbi:3-hydroxyacyl-CoA dehydrogenase family protein [Clostridium sp. 001]|uniref:3-hydroxyacyl-CoA dehydrogenase family protein n=1 Tax=Clostridium sp. 001 TaxID=1970093 RepID=UPI001C2C5A12|nr:3-hydroxyacyl-CoA dehydrogenase family protein [Clostridium sp. 001]QXE17674.1 3-hydroxybutyryl-CoA dehydrogenase [Clostridium sp. 001]